MKYLYTLLIGALFFCACSKKIDVDAPEFKVSTAKQSYKVGDTVQFLFDGKPGNIVFYSGEAGKNYDYKDRTQAVGEAQLEFTSFIGNKGEVNTLQLLASTDFSGAADAVGIAAATWTDITARGTLSTGIDNTASGVISLSDFASQGKPLYLAFRYLGYNHTTLKQPTWAIRTLSVNNVLPEGASLVTTSTAAGWVAADLKNPTVVWDIRANGQLVITGTAATATKDDNEDWVISKPLNLSAVTPDAGNPIRDIGSVSLIDYQYVYLKPGTYTATFLAFNNTIDDNKSVLRQIQITINP